MKLFALCMALTFVEPIEAPRPETPQPTHKKLWKVAGMGQRLEVEKGDMIQVEVLTVLFSDKNITLPVKLTGDRCCVLIGNLAEVKTLKVEEKADGVEIKVKDGELATHSAFILAFSKGKCELKCLIPPFPDPEKNVLQAAFKSLEIVVK